VFSEPGFGTTFRVYLPAAARSRIARAEEEADPADVPAGARVLLVEDEPAVREFTERALSHAGFHVTSVSSAEEAAALAADERPDLLITDLLLPGANGLALASRLRERWPDLPVLFVSGYPHSAVLRRGLDVPAEAFLSKPFGISELAAAAARVMRSGAGTPPVREP
jgi:two-component system cell cycle sensor histidine kinase/response regulator CckA